MGQRPVSLAGVRPSARPRSTRSGLPRGTVTFLTTEVELPMAPGEERARHQTLDDARDLLSDQKLSRVSLFGQCT